MVTVLVLSVDPTFADLTRRNLDRRGFGVVVESSSTCCEQTTTDAGSIHVVVADLDCPPPLSWRAATRLRRRFGFSWHPLVLLVHDLPDGRRSRSCQPCRYLRKPVAMDEMLRAIQDLALREAHAPPAGRTSASEQSS